MQINHIHFQPGLSLASQHRNQKRINVIGFLNPTMGQLRSHLKAGSVDSDFIIQVMGAIAKQ